MNRSLAQIVLINRKEVQVRFSETDPMGVVWHGNYVQYFEDGREAFGLQYGLGYRDYFDNKLGAPVVKLSIDYKRPVLYGDDIVIETIYQFTEAAKIVFEYKIFNSRTNELVATAKSTQVFTDVSGNLILTRPPFYEAWLRKTGLI